jgi:formimidoylglutamate deiminase
MSDEQGWYPDYLFAEGQVQTGTALFADESGTITRFSKLPADLQRAERLPGRALLPGLVNVHSHTFQRVIRGSTESRQKGERDTFWTWREKMYQAAMRLTPERIYQTARAAFLEMLLSGITSVGEFHYLHHQPDGTRYEDPNLTAKLVIQAAREVGLRIVLLRTAYERAGYRKPANRGQLRFLTKDPDEFISDTEALCSWVSGVYSANDAAVGVAPHSVRALKESYLRTVIDFARWRDLPVHMHVSEQPDENESSIQEYGLSPISWLDRMGFLADWFTVIHGIHITEEEAHRLAVSGSPVCACPTSERNLGDGPVPADYLFASGGSICLGTDSQIQIDLLEDARLLEYHLRMCRLERAVLDPVRDGSEPLAKRLFEAASLAGAKALAQPVGELAVGKPADFISIDLNDLSIAGATSDTLMSLVVFSLERTAVKDVYVAGQPLVIDGYHPLQETIVTDFRRGLSEALRNDS